MYEMKTTFQTDFTIADMFGLGAISETYERAFKEWKDNYIYLTELVLVLNWKIWEWYEKCNEPYAHLYEAFWDEACRYALDNLKGDELKYYLEVTD